MYTPPLLAFDLRLFDSVFWLMETCGCACVSLCGFYAVTMLGCAVLRVPQLYSFISVSLISALRRMTWGWAKYRWEKKRDCTFQSPPLLSCRGKVWLSQLEYINKSAFSSPITVWHMVCMFFIYYWSSVAHRQWVWLTHEMTFDCMWCFKISRSKMYPFSTTTFERCQI